MVVLAWTFCQIKIKSGQKAEMSDLNHQQLIYDDGQSSDISAFYRPIRQLYYTVSMEKVNECAMGRQS